ncbi:MAG TPA: type III PLP-dependent enzyme [Amaricoccus sp.]|uniref:type III PLP-dependent enzyme n=1 Tax=Amaricoccus sp. TaxID=1872485 RepID=UPI002B52C40B|nr:type III PLP-dependent enzyme [Amaricoccus sp.]HMR54151.1 type III PLP-dependent enzyme [Amaricoccus sp.]HMU01168.1 type III PLP-dependent enzyme [Amaricoccus sp.]
MRHVSALTGSVALFDAHPQDSAVSARQDAFIRSRDFDRPTMIFDLDMLRGKYRALAGGLGDASIHYAVKANPAPEVIGALLAEGAHFDAASRGEIDLCLSLGVAPEHIAFGNTIKRAADIAHAHSVGVRQFAADAEEEIYKIAENAPGARVILRMLVTASEADWPLTRKFGCSHREALRLMDLGRAVGLDVAGISFHAGSQMREPAMWAGALDGALALWEEARDAGHALRVLNIGGGFPAFYGDPLPETRAYAAEVMRMVRARFGTEVSVMAEPGRGLVAEAGVIVAEVLLVSRKDDDDLHRWVFLDIGKFSGLAETMDEAIRYQFETRHGDAETGPCILAGPSCDSADVLYEKRPVQLPLALRSGDRIRVLCTGAYTTSYSSVGFNGFPPLDSVFLG